jgi:hypothetical protein
MNIEKSHVLHNRRRLRQQKRALANCSLLVWRTAPGPTLHIPAIPLCLGRRWCRRANLRVHWEPAERIDSERCVRDRLRRRRDHEDRALLWDGGFT